MGKYEIPQQNTRERPGESGQSSDNPELEAIAQWLSTVKFRRRILGGVDAVDVWEKIGELNALYQKALTAERVRCYLVLRQLRRRPGEAQPEESNGKP